MQVLGRLHTRHDAAESAGRAAAVVQGDAARRIPAAQGFPVITAERRQKFLNSSIVLTPAPQGHSTLRRRLVEPLWVLFAVTAVLLGLACLNVAGLFLARGSARDREIGTRLALGASRGRLGRQLLADSLLIALCGGLLGTAAAPMAVRALIAFLPRGNAGNALHSAVDSRLLLFAFAISVTAGVLSGLAPALQSGRRSLVSSLRERGGYRIRRGPASKVYCDGPDCLDFDPGHRSGVVCTDSRRADGEGPGVCYIEPGLVRHRHAAKRVFA